MHYLSEDGQGRREVARHLMAAMQRPKDNVRGMVWLIWTRIRRHARLPRWQESVTFVVRGYQLAPQPLMPSKRHYPQLGRAEACPTRSKRIKWTISKRKAADVPSLKSFQIPVFWLPATRISLRPARENKNERKTRHILLICSHPRVMQPPTEKLEPAVSLLGGRSDR